MLRERITNSWKRLNISFELVSYLVATRYYVVPARGNEMKKEKCIKKSCACHLCVAVIISTTMKTCMTLMINKRNVSIF